MTSDYFDSLLKLHFPLNNNSTCFVVFYFYFQHVLKQYGLKKSIEAHFNRLKMFLLYFYDAYDVNVREKKIRQKYDLFMQNKCLYKISWFKEQKRHSWRLRLRGHRRKFHAIATKFFLLQSHKTFFPCLYS